MIIMTQASFPPSRSKELGKAFQDLPEGVCPQVFPAIADDPESFTAEMQSKKIRAPHWPQLPNEIKGNSQYPVANFLAEHLFRLPVHQDVNPNYLKSVTI